MTRRRMINPSIWESTKVNALSRDARLLFIGLISNADDDGCFRADVRAIRKAVFGMDDLTVDQVGKWLEEVKAMPTIHFYEAEGEQYGHFKNWRKHQTLREDRRVPSSHPPCPDCPQGDGVVTTERQPTAAKVKGREVKEIYGHEGFQRFWVSYPRKVAKTAAIQAWNRLAPDEKLLRQILKSLDAYRQSESWTKDGGRFIPHPATWLNGRRFEDELPKTQESFQDRRMREDQAKVDAILSAPRVPVKVPKLKLS